MANDIPIVCDLNDEEFRERERLVLDGLKSLVISHAETPDGFAYTFPRDDKVVSQLTELITLERKCCPFLDFQLTGGTGGQDIRLELSGPPGAKEFISSTFNRS